MFYETRVARVPESQDFTKVQGSGFHKNRENAVSQEITLFEVGFVKPKKIQFSKKGLKR